MKRTFAAERPSVYLDQWVWIRLAKADVGRPQERDDASVLAAVRAASEAGVAFPLSASHYFETLKITHPRQRKQVAGVMAPISRCRAIRGGQALIRHQMLTAMFESFGRPAFRPTSPAVLGVGAYWALVGEHGSFRVHDQRGPVEPQTVPGLASWLREANQFAELKLLAGPEDDEVDELVRLGYDPNPAHDAERSRLAWELRYERILSEDSISLTEMRVRLQARELIHEYLGLFNELMAEYRINPDRAFGVVQSRPRASRPGMVEFADRIPTLRVAVELKLRRFSNTSKKWGINDLRDIDALSRAVPYCDVVVADKEMAGFATQARIHEDYGTRIISRLSELPAELPSLIQRSADLGGDTSGWDWLGPGEGFNVDEPTPFAG